MSCRRWGEELVLHVEALKCIIAAGERCRSSPAGGDVRRGRRQVVAYVPRESPLRVRAKNHVAVTTAVGAEGSGHGPIAKEPICRAVVSTGFQLSVQPFEL